MNAKNELLKILYGKANTLCAEIHTADKAFLLKPSYTQKKWDQFAQSIDFEYCNQTGSQKLFGTVWLKDGSWFTRVWDCNEFKCTEYWEYHKYPKIPKELIK